jgi:hypothetical protein
MPAHLDPAARAHPDSRAPGDFLARLEASLQDADRQRSRQTLLRRARRILPVVLLVGPVVAWRLILASPGSAHSSISALAWLTFLLDVGVQVDNALLGYLGLQWLPSVVGGLLLVLITGWLLSSPPEKK